MNEREKCVVIQGVEMLLNLSVFNLFCYENAKEKTLSKARNLFERRFYLFIYLIVTFAGAI